jgi:hypothetical protein
VPVSARAKRGGMVIHRRIALGPDDVTAHQGIPVTTPAMTLLDHACRLNRGQIERMINEADKLGLVKPPALRTFLEEHPRRDGVARLKAVLDRRGFVFTEPGLEEAFLPIAEGPLCRFRSPSGDSTASKSTSSGQNWASWSRPTGSPTTARLPSRRAIACAIKPTPPPG